MNISTPSVRKGMAELSKCGTYRYRLSRLWSSTVEPLCFLMLNPSTADATEDDPTIRKCIGFAMRFNYGGIVVVNLFAFRSTDPSGLLTASDPVGPDNDRWIERTVADRDVVCAWGSAGAGARRRLTATRVQQVAPLVQSSAARVLRLATCKDGSPSHPLMLSYNRPLLSWTHA